MSPVPITEIAIAHRDAVVSVPLWHRWLHGLVGLFRETRQFPPQREGPDGKQPALGLLWEKLGEQKNKGNVQGQKGAEKRCREMRANCKSSQAAGAAWKHWGTADDHESCARWWELQTFRQVSQPWMLTLSISTPGHSGGTEPSMSYSSHPRHMASHSMAKRCCSRRNPITCPPFT